MRYQKLVSVNEVTIVMEVWKLWWNFHGETWSGNETTDCHAVRCQLDLSGLDCSLSFGFPHVSA